MAYRFMHDLKSIAGFNRSLKISCNLRLIRHQHTPAWITKVLKSESIFKHHISFNVHRRLFSEKNENSKESHSEFFEPKKEITMKQFFDNYLSSGKVREVEVVDSKLVRVKLVPGSDIDASKILWFRIGNSGNFEQNLEKAQIKMNLKPSEFITVNYTEESKESNKWDRNHLLVALAFTAVFIAGRLTLEIRHNHTTLDEYRRLLSDKISPKPDTDANSTEPPQKRNEFELHMKFFDKELTFVNPFLYKKITMNEFFQNYLPSGKVKQVEVVNYKWVRVELFPGPDIDALKILWFRVPVGTLGNFECNLEKAQIEMNLKPSEFITVIHAQQLEGFEYLLNLFQAGMVLTAMSVIAVGITLFLSIKKKLNNTDVKFSDVAGCEEAKLEIMEFVNFLKNPQKYHKLGAKIPKGAILTGPPGTGKTLLAKATAGEANVPFITLNVSEFQERSASFGHNKVRQTFELARKNAPCILFIDEIDSLGRNKTGGNIDQDKTLNQLLVEMDGLKKQTGVVVLAATNSVDQVDPALLQPGRFDRHIDISLPDIKGRASIFKVHLSRLKTELSISDLASKLADLTTGFSGADIAKVCNEAALIAARDNKTSIQMTHFEQAIERVLAG